MKSPVFALLALALTLLTGCTPKASKESLIGYWSLDEKSVQSWAAKIDPESKDTGAQIGRMLIKMAARGITVEFTDTEVRQILDGEPSPAKTYAIQSLDGPSATITVGKETTTYTFVSRSSMESVVPGTTHMMRLNKLDATGIEALKKKMDAAANGPAADAPATARVDWLLKAAPEKFAAYLAKHPDSVGLKNDKGDPILNLAAKRNRVALAKALVAAGADKNAKDSEGKIAFMHAAGFSYSPELAALLVTDTVDRDFLNTELTNALRRKLNLEKAELLVAHGASVEQGWSPNKTRFLEAVGDSNLPVAKFLLKHGANINAIEGMFEDTALHVAVKSGSLEMIEFLLEQGMPVTIKNKSQHSPITAVLHRDKNKIEAVKLLVNAGANINEPGVLDQTLLVAAVEKKNNDFAKALIEAGADFDSSFGDSRFVKPPSAYQTAKTFKNDEMVAFMDARRAASAAAAGQ